jgi:hypothetical protein
VEAANGFSGKGEASGRAENRTAGCEHDLDVSPSGRIAACRLCGFVGHWRDGVWNRVGDPHSAPPNVASDTPHSLADQERMRLRRALHVIAFEPFGPADATDRQVLYAITEFARETLEGGAA